MQETVISYTKHISDKNKRNNVCCL